MILLYPESDQAVKATDVSSAYLINVSLGNELLIPDEVVITGELYLDGTYLYLAASSLTDTKKR